MTKRFLSPLSTNHVDFNQTHPSTTAVGRVLWDDGEGTLSVGLKGGHVNLQIGQENVVLAYNGTGSTIADGSVVYISGAQGQRPSVTLAQANAEATSSKVLGIATEPIANGAEGFISTFGVVNGVDTSSFTAGDALWLSPTVAGGLTATKPVAPNHMVFVGYALHINASSGRIFVNPQNGYELDELHDVLMGTKTDRDVLMYESATGLWKNEQINLGTDTVGNYVASVSGTDGVSISGTGEGAAVTIANSDKGSSQNIFKNVAVSGQTTVVADSNNDTLTFANGTGITITTNATTDTVTVTNSGVTALTGTANEIDVSASTGSVTLSLPATINANTTGNAATVTNGVYTTGSYADPSWITSLAWSKISGEPTTLSGYGITDALSNSTTSTQDGYFGNIYLYDDSTPSHYLAITNSANLTAARTLSVNVNNADRTVSLSGNLTVSAAATVSGTNTGDQTITLTGDVTGSGTGSFATTLANSGVTAGTYNNVATEVRPFTVDAKGRITGIGTAVTITPAWSSITSKPTTLSGYGITDAINTSATEQTKSGNLNIGGNLAVTGNLTINGTTTTVNSTTVTVDDPILTLGGDTAPVADDNKDRGIEFRYYDTQARLGFMGYDDSEGTFVFLTAATNTSEVFTGTKGTIDANISGSNINAGTVSATYIDSAIARLASPTFTGTVVLPATTSIGNVSSTEIGYLDGVTSSIQTQLGNKQPLDADLTAIAALAGTSGFLKKTAADTWSLDTSTYLTANQTITLSGDASGSGTTSIVVTVADDSHNHIISNVDGLQTALDGKEPTITAGTTAQYWRGDKTWQTLNSTAVGLGNVENTALSTWAGTTNITTLGTVATGTWQAGDLLPATDNTGVVGNATNTWSNGQFTNLTVDSTLTVTSTLNVRAAIDLADADILRWGSSDDVTSAYNGTTNRLLFNIVTASAGIDFAYQAANVMTIGSTGVDLLGTPTAPTATAGTNTTQIATTAFVTAAVSASGSGSVSTDVALSNAWWMGV